MTNSYIIERVVDDTVTAVLKLERDGTISWLRPTYSGYQFATHFREKHRAEKVLQKANKINTIGTLRVQMDMGTYTAGSKATIAPLPKREPHHR